MKRLLFPAAVALAAWLTPAMAQPSSSRPRSSNSLQGLEEAPARLPCLAAAQAGRVTALGGPAARETEQPRAALCNSSEALPDHGRDPVSDFRLGARPAATSSYRRIAGGPLYHRICSAIVPHRRTHRRGRGTRDQPRPQRAQGRGDPRCPDRSVRNRPATHRGGRPRRGAVAHGRSAGGRNRRVQLVDIGR